MWTQFNPPVRIEYDHVEAQCFAPPRIGYGPVDAQIVAYVRIENGHADTPFNAPVRIGYDHVGAQCIAPLQIENGHADAPCIAPLKRQKRQYCFWIRICNNQQPQRIQTGNALPIPAFSW